MSQSELGKMYTDGEIICNEGEAGEHMFVVQSGSVDVIKKLSEGEIPLTTLTSGDIFGEMALFDKLPRSATVKAKGKAVVLRIDKKGFFAKASNDPSLAFNILSGMSKRIRALNDELINFNKNTKAEISDIDINNTGKTILNEARRFLSSDNGSVMLMDEKTGELKIIAACGSDAMQKIVFKEGKGIAGDVIKTGKVEFIADTSADSRFIPGQTMVTALICVPVFCTKKVIGVVNLSNNTSQFNNSTDVNLLNFLSLYASAAIENARIISGTEDWLHAVNKLFYK